MIYLQKNLYLLYKQSLVNKKKQKQFFWFFEKLCNAVYDHFSGRTIYAVDSQGQVICALFNIWDSHREYDFISALDPDYRSTGAQDLLIYSVIEFLSDKVDGYDFEGSMIEGVGESYRRFGSHQTPYFRLNKIYTGNPLLKAALSHVLR